VAVDVLLRLAGGFGSVGGELLLVLRAVLVLCCFLGGTTCSTQRRIPNLPDFFPALDGVGALSRAGAPSI